MGKHQEETSPRDKEFFGFQFPEVSLARGPALNAPNPVLKASKCIDLRVLCKPSLFLLKVLIHRA